MIQSCPLCGKTHDSEDHDVDWVFVACCTRLVWKADPLRLEMLEDEPEGPGPKITFTAQIPIKNPRSFGVLS